MNQAAWFHPETDRSGVHKTLHFLIQVAPALWSCVFLKWKMEFGDAEMFEGVTSSRDTQRSGWKSRSSVLSWGLNLWHFGSQVKILISKRHRWLHELRLGHGVGLWSCWFPPGRKCESRPSSQDLSCPASFKSSTWSYPSPILALAICMKTDGPSREAVKSLLYASCLTLAWSLGH